MRTDHYFDSAGEGKIHYCRWLPEGEVKAVVQFVHGIGEHILRYDDFAQYLNSLGIGVVAEDHMGHGESMKTGTQGYFAGGWFAAVADTYALLQKTREVFPDVPYVIFGHSMGSFMTRTLIAKYPESGISGAVICGSNWMGKPVLVAGKAAAGMFCKKVGERNPSQTLDQIVFGSYNKRVEHKRTKYDWLTRDDKIVDAYAADSKCGFVASVGLLRDMLAGMTYNQRPETLAAMKKDLPVYIVAGGDDPVGDYGAGVRKLDKEFRKAGMEQVELKIYPLCRHEIHNELNRREVYEDFKEWLERNVL